MSCVICKEVIAYRCQGCDKFYCNNCRWDYGHVSVKSCENCDKTLCQENFSYQYRLPFDQDGSLRSHSWCNLCVSKRLSDFNNNPKKQRK